VNLVLSPDAPSETVMPFNNDLRVLVRPNRWPRFDRRGLN